MGVNTSETKGNRKSALTAMALQQRDGRNTMSSCTSTTELTEVTLKALVITVSYLRTRSAWLRREFVPTFPS